MSNVISCLCVVGFIWAALAIIGGLRGRGRSNGSNWGNQGYNNQGWGQSNNTGLFGSLLGGMGIGWLLGGWGHNDHNHHINNNDTIVDSNNDGIADTGNSPNSTIVDSNNDGIADTGNNPNNNNDNWFDWGNNNNDTNSNDGSGSGDWGNDSGGGGDWGSDSGGGDSGGGWGGDSA